MNGCSTANISFHNVISDCKRLLGFDMLLGKQQQRRIKGMMGYVDWSVETWCGLCNCASGKSACVKKWVCISMPSRHNGDHSLPVRTIKHAINRCIASKIVECNG